ncbi:MAG: flagellar assembly protein FliH [Candidatus Scalindua sp.]|nr:flagellar assembly protein FliH [Candidatus Scalindua sp.]
MSRKIVYKLPVIEKTVVLETKLPSLLKKPPEDEKIEAENRQKQLEDITRESYQRGWNDAEKKMKSQIVEENNLLCKGLKKAAEEFRNERNSIWENCEKEILHLALTIAEKVTSAEISKYNREITERIAAEAVCKVKGKKIAKICMNEKDLEGFKLKKISGINEVSGECEIIADNDISPGGCVVVTDYGSVDARLETRWDEIMTTLGVDDNTGERKK